MTVMVSNSVPSHISDPSIPILLL